MEVVPGELSLNAAASPPRMEDGMKDGRRPVDGVSVGEIDGPSVAIMDGLRDGSVDGISVEVG